MDNDYSNESMLDIYIYETTQNIEQLETLILASEKAASFTADMINEIFRIMHTIKGSSAMMTFNNIASLAHAIEDLFYVIRENGSKSIDYAILSDLVLEGVDFIKLELEKVKNSDNLDGDPDALLDNVRKFLSAIKDDTADAKQPSEESKAAAPQNQSLSIEGLKPGQKLYEAVIYFEDGCQMENLRAYGMIHSLKDIVEDFRYFPEDIEDSNESIRIIREQGFRITLRSEKCLRELHEFFAGGMFVRDIELTEVSEAGQTSDSTAEDNAAASKIDAEKTPKLSGQEQEAIGRTENRNSHQSIISVDVMKLDKLMDLMGEMVIAEAMVTQNPELKGLKLSSFYKASRLLQKITSEMQDMVMSIRMVPLSATFHKMQRIVRDMGRKLNKEVMLELIGETTEVDKNIIEHISDPLMHLVRNAVDHGIEMPKERLAAGKAKTGTVTLEAENAGSDVIVTVRDDGNGLDKEKILKKAAKAGLLIKPESEMTDKEIYNLIFLPGFSTNESVTEFSGRGVGMDVVVKNLEAVGGSVSIDSVMGAGTVTTLKIPLTLAIIDGMNIRVGDAKYTLPTTSIHETFRAKEKDLFQDPERNEMIMVRGNCYPVLRLHKEFEVSTDITDFTQGIMVMIEQDERYLCLFADELLGQHQVVVKALPAYLKRIRKLEGLAGCTLLGDGSISLILNVGGLISMQYVS